MGEPAAPEVAGQCRDLLDIGALDDRVGGAQPAGFVAVCLLAGGGIDDDGQGSEPGLAGSPDLEVRAIGLATQVLYPQEPGFDVFGCAVRAPEKPGLSFPLD